MLKKCLLWIIPLVVLLGSQAAFALFRQEKTPSEGEYVGEVSLSIDSVRMPVAITLAKTSKADQMLITGQAVRPDARPIEIRGTYYVAKNRFAAFGEVRGDERALTLTMDGKWDVSQFVIKQR